VQIFTISLLSCCADMYYFPAVMLCRYVLFLSPARSDELEKWDAIRGCNQMSPL